MIYICKGSMIIFLVSILFTPINASNESNTDIMSYQKCPKSVISGIYLDGGTSLFKVATKENNTLYFGLENSNELIIYNSENTLSIEEKEYIKKNRHINIFINAPHPNREGVEILSRYVGVKKRSRRLRVKNEPQQLTFKTI